MREQASEPDSEPQNQNKTLRIPTSQVRSTKTAARRYRKRRIRYDRKANQNICPCSWEKAEIASATRPPEQQRDPTFPKLCTPDSWW